MGFALVIFRGRVNTDEFDRTGSFKYRCTLLYKIGHFAIPLCDIIPQAAKVVQVLGMAVRHLLVPGLDEPLLVVVVLYLEQDERPEGRLRNDLIL